MTKKTPEEIEALKAQSQALKAEKERKKAEKKAKFGDANAEKNMPVCLIPIPWEWDMGSDARDKPPNADWTKRDGRWWKHVSNEDLDKPKWRDYIDGIEQLWRNDPCYGDHGVDYSLKYTGPCKRKVVRT